MLLRTFFRRTQRRQIFCKRYSSDDSQLKLQFLPRTNQKYSNISAMIFSFGENEHRSQKSFELFANKGLGLDTYVVKWPVNITLHYDQSRQRKMVQNLLRQLKDENIEDVFVICLKCGGFSIFKHFSEAIVHDNLK